MVERTRSRRRTSLVLVALSAGLACRTPERASSAPRVTVTDDAGRSVTLAAPARRIVSLLPSFTEMLFAIGAGDRMVGRTAWCDYPPAARAVPSVGDGIPPNVEAVAARNPDLVVLYRSGANGAVRDELARLGIAAALFDLNRLEDLAPVARRLGILTDRRTAGDSLAQSVDSLATRAPAPPTRSLAFVVWDNPPIVIGRGSYLDQLAALAGARNVFHDIASPSAQVSIETISARDPDVIAVLTDTARLPAFAARREWRAVPAVRRRRFLYLPGTLFGRPTPRAPLAVRELRALLERRP